MADNVKYNLLGFNQEMLCFLNKEKWTACKDGTMKRTVVSLQPEDLFVLDWFIDDIWKLKRKGPMRIEKSPLDGEDYVNIQYFKTSKYFPFLFSNRYAVTKSLERMVYLKLLKFYLHKSGGTYSCYRPNEELLELILYSKKRLDDNKMEEAFDTFLDKFVIPNGMFLLPTEEDNKKVKNKGLSKIDDPSDNKDDSGIVE